MSRSLLAAALATALAASALAQAPTQTVRGTVLDVDRRTPLVGATVVVAYTDPLLGAATDASGRFRIEGVPVGRHDFVVSYVGYEPRVLREVVVGSGRGVVLDVALREAAYQAGEVVVTAGAGRAGPLDPLAVASARLLHVEQAGRYAGALDDPARLVGTFAGAASTLADNAVVVRGNAPKGLLWRMEGVEIPTPTHFANLLTFGGGGITALSTRMLADSDFFLGAFPAEYGGALSGVFDLRVRTGNTERREQAVRAGVLGLDASAEGPLLGGSYFANYRYSTFALIGPLLPEDAGGIHYQNLAFKVVLPAGRGGTVSAFGIGATDRSGQAALRDPSEWVYERDREDVESPTRFGAASLQHRQTLGGWGFVESSLTATGNGLRWRLDEATPEGRLVPRQRVRSEQGRLAAASTLNARVARGHTNRTGAVLSRLGYGLDVRRAEGEGSLKPVAVTEGSALHAQAFSQSRVDLGRVTLTAGAHVQHLALTEETSVEPRVGVAWRPAAGHTLSLAYGLHAQREVLSLYFSHPQNRRLRMTRAHHLVGAYTRGLGPHVTATVEGYVQALDRVPVAAGTPFSALNLELDWFVREPLVNEGAGRNVGVEVSVERHLAGGWYGLLTGTAFSSRYRGGDGLWRPTRFDRGVVGNVLAGREWTFRGRRSTRTLGVNGRVSAMGGRRATPVDEEASREARQVVYEESRAFSLREPAALYGDLTVEYRVHRGRTTTVWAAQVLNLTAYEEVYGHRYNLRDGRVEVDREAIVLPSLSVTLEW
jgi:hypothetical protein